MIQLRKWSQQPSGQVLIATLFFCFIFIALFIGLFRSGLIYGEKERAIRAANVTALSAGAVYANGMQLVRESNMISFAFAVANTVLLATGVGEMIALTSFITLDFNPLKMVEAVQKVQDVIFGIKQPIGLYPLLIATETFSVAGQNGIKDTWPTLDPTTWSFPSSIPSPILFFNIASLGPETIQSLKPNMALKFRDGSFLPTLQPLKLYQLNRNGIERTYTADQVELAPNSKGANYRVKKNSGLFGAGWYVSEISTPGSDKLNKLITALNGLTALKLDVVDRDSPPLHNIFLYGTYPTTIKDNNGNNDQIQVLSQIGIYGSGLEFWKVADPPYRALLSTTDPVELAQELGIRSLISQFMGQFPTGLNDLLKGASGGII